MSSDNEDPEFEAAIGESRDLYHNRQDDGASTSSLAGTAAYSDILEEGKRSHPQHIVALGTSLNSIWR
jgi:hypothetical protein